MLEGGIVIMENAVIENIKKRRTIRKFKPEQITEEKLNIILEAGLYAPSAGGRQGVLFVVSQDKDTNEKLGRIKKAHFHGKMSTDTVYISKQQPSIADDATIVNAFYDAPTMITLFAPKSFLYAESDACVAAENMLLAATSLGVGSCYIGSAWDSFDNPFGKEILKQWKVRTDYFAVLHVLLGYPKDAVHPTARPRKEDRIIRG
jgi:nitroreductase